MNEQTTQFLLESAERLREEHHRISTQLAYTAPEAVTPQTRQWLATNEVMIDLFDAAAAASESPLREKVVVLAGALLSDYSDPVDLSDLKTKVLERIQADGIFESQVETAVLREELGLNNEEDG